MNDTIRDKLKLLPDSPGVYRMYNSLGEIIYVGKAVNLKNRVRQYFQNTAKQPKVAAMVSNVADFEFTITASEVEALNLECNMIKQNRPRYNILLKDDKHFPYVRIDFSKDFPRPEIVRRVKKDGARYFGPYLSAQTLREAIVAIRDFFPVRHCKKDIAKAISRRERPCLMYHIGKCCAPCSGNVTREEYHKYLDEIAQLLQGHCRPVVEELTLRMNEAAERLDYERAALCRDRIRAMESLAAKQRAATTVINSFDVFAAARDDMNTVVYATMMRDGNVVMTDSYFVTASEESDAEVMASFLTQFYLDSGYVPNEIVCRTLPNDAEGIAEWLRNSCGHAVRIIEPRRGEKKQLAEMAFLNGTEALKRKRELTLKEWERGEGALADLTRIVGMDELPHRMECFDNSHFQGRDTVGSMVVFIDGKPDKSLYRRFRTRTQSEGDDYEAMREHLTRRFQRAAEGDAKFNELPDLLVVDGGRGQLNVALEVLSEFGLSYIPAIGLAERNEDIILPDREEPVSLPKSSSTLHLLQRIRDEAHRFAITYHRSMRSKTALFSVLQEIEGVGEKRRRALFDRFLTMDAIKAATVEELASADGMNAAAAKNVYGFFHKDEKEPHLKYKLLAIDIDDTLLPRNGRISARNKRAIKAAEDAGIYVTLATGRGYHGCSAVREELGIERLIINYGGALISDPVSGKPFMTTELDSAVVTEIMDLAGGLGLHVHLYQGDEIVYEHEHEYGRLYSEHLGLPARIEPNVRKMIWHNVPKVLVITEPERVPDLLPYFTEKLKGKAAVSASSPGFIEFNKIGASKGSALKMLAEHLGIGQSETAAIGDNTLDKEMIEWAGLGCCVADGNEEVKAAADVIAPGCADDGVAFFIENYLLKERE
ncbi:MAG: excinuclease ABC subunit UvrC [Clostridia bacterium]|nr:excinuclease ABC subunit UvrC [Clostridia bacterium]